MGFIASATTINIKGKLTPIGRQRLATNNNGLITKFSLGDSDANYNVFSGLTAGQIPDFSGDNFGASVNNGGANYEFKSNLYVSGVETKKAVEASSVVVNSVFSQTGFVEVPYSAGSISQMVIDRKDSNTNTYVNLFYSFSLPLNESEKRRYTATTSNSGGYADTALSGLAFDKILVIGIGGSQYGELIDGKTIKLDLTTTASTYTIYGTYENKGANPKIEDQRVYDVSANLTKFGPNRCLLFSDQIRRPNADASLSWATGWGTYRPFSMNGKKGWNFRNNPSLNVTADTAVGVAYLDKGFLVITEPTIVSEFEDALLAGASGTTATTVTYNSVVSTISQQITCIANRGEFGVSNNPTFANGDTPRITEVGLFDSENNLIAVAKTTRTYYKPLDDLVVFNLRIDY